MKVRIMLRGENNSRLIGVGVSDELTFTSGFDPQALDAFISRTSGRHRFVTLSYELGRAFLPGTFTSDDRSGFPLLQVWVPETLYTLSDGKVSYSEGEISPANEQLAAGLLGQGGPVPHIEWQAASSREQYLESVETLKKHIQRGDIYETNFCQEFFAENVAIADGPSVFRALDEVTSAPFSVYYESDDFLVASASPERFIRREQKRLISQPIKGTAPRHADPEQDEKNRVALSESEKDRAENVMIVDLVRNDLSRVAAKNSVRVDELFGIHTFSTVHQMISTVSCELRRGTRFSEILRATFPMGSMTGAPKMSAVRLSDTYEGFSRGIYSGSMGFIAPGEASFDLNVMIRTLVYDKKRRRISCAVGGAITMASDPQEEYRECQTKVGRILEIFGPCQW